MFTPLVTVSIQIGRTTATELMGDINSNWNTKFLTFLNKSFLSKSNKKLLNFTFKLHLWFLGIILLERYVNTIYLRISIMELRWCAFSCCRKASNISSSSASSSAPLRFGAIVLKKKRQRNLNFDILKYFNLTWKVKSMKIYLHRAKIYT